MTNWISARKIGDLRAGNGDKAYINTVFLKEPQAVGNCRYDRSNANGS